MQCLGVVAVASYTIILMTGCFFLIKKTVGLRVNKNEEIKGLDSTEHGLPSAYADFAPSTVAYADYIKEDTVVVSGDVPPSEAIEVNVMPKLEPKKASSGPKFTKVEIILK